MTYIGDEEVVLLNSILPFLLFEEKFNIVEVHKRNILAPANNKSQVDATIDNFEKNGFYIAIMGFLVDNKFAAPINDDINNNLFVLTPKGQYLAAYGDLDAYGSSLNLQLTIEEIKLRLPTVLEQLEPYSEFQLVANPRPKSEDIILPPQEMGINDKLDYIHSMLAKKQGEFKEMILKEQLDIIKDERVAQYLVHNGFAVNRHDIKLEDRIFRQFTDKGRKLKELGSLDAFNDWEQEEKRIENRRKLLTDKVLELNIDNIEIQKSQMWFNFWIASGTIEICLFTADNLIRNQYNCVYPFYRHYALPYCAVLTPILLAIRLALKLRRRRNTSM